MPRYFLSITSRYEEADSEPVEVHPTAEQLLCLFAEQEWQYRIRSAGVWQERIWRWPMQLAVQDLAHRLSTLPEVELHIKTHRYWVVEELLAQEEGWPAGLFEPIQWYDVNTGQVVFSTRAVTVLKRCPDVTHWADLLRLRPRRQSRGGYYLCSRTEPDTGGGKLRNFGQTSYWDVREFLEKRFGIPEDVVFNDPRYGPLDFDRCKPLE
jgi:hypothetical protein